MVPPANKNSLAVVVHGGAGAFSAERVSQERPFLKVAVDAAWRELVSGKSGEYAVAAALRVLEECEYFNAGYGGYPNKFGIVLLDVGIMRGNRDFISLINVRRIKYPSAAALDMLHAGPSRMTIWTHELMQQVDNGSAELKARYGHVLTHEEMVPPSLKRLLEQEEVSEVDVQNAGHGTVGCVVRDAAGRLCAGTSTGGTKTKLNGRVGDSPIVGSGVFADDDIGALSVSGHGESILMSALSPMICAEIRRELRRSPGAFETDGNKLKSIIDAELAELRRKAPDRGAGVIIVPPRGAPACAFNTRQFAVGLRTGSVDRTTQEYFDILGTPL